MSDLHTALTSAMQLIGLAKVAIDARDEAKAKSALMDLTLKLNDVSISALSSTEKAMTLQNSLREAQDENRALKLAAEERQGYVLTEVCPGSHAYKSKAGQDGDDTPAHYLCQPCYDKRIKSVLRFSRASTTHNAHWTCPEEARHGLVQHGTQIPMPLLPRRTSFMG